MILIVAAFLVWFFVIKQNRDDEPPDAPIAPIVVAEEPEEAQTDEVEEELPEAAPVEVISDPVVLAIIKRNGKKSIINVGDLDVVFADGDTVSIEILKAKGLIPQTAKRYKVLTNGTLTKVLTVEADEFSPTAKDKILAAGGQVVKTGLNGNA